MFAISCKKMSTSFDNPCGLNFQQCPLSTIVYVKAMDQGRPLEGARVHNNFLLTTLK